MVKKRSFIIVSLILLSLALLVIAAVPTINSASITPTSPSTTDDLIGFCNATESGSDNVTYSWKWYQDGTQFSRSDEYNVTLMDTYSGVAVYTTYDVYVNGTYAYVYGSDNFDFSNINVLQIDTIQEDLDILQKFRANSGGVRALAGGDGFVFVKTTTAIDTYEINASNLLDYVSNITDEVSDGTEIVTDIQYANNKVFTLDGEIDTNKLISYDVNGSGHLSLNDTYNFGTGEQTHRLWTNGSLIYAGFEDLDSSPDKQYLYVFSVDDSTGDISLENGYNIFDSDTDYISDLLVINDTLYIAAAGRLLTYDINGYALTETCTLDQSEAQAFSLYYDGYYLYAGHSDYAGDPYFTSFEFASDGCPVLVEQIDGAFGAYRMDGFGQWIVSSDYSDDLHLIKINDKTYQDGSIDRNLNNISSTDTDFFEDWTFSCRAGDSAGIYSSWTNSSTVTIDSTLSDCYTITLPGTYTLNQSISSSGEHCIVVNSDDVIVDGAGYSLTGDGIGTYHAIAAVSNDNITIKNFGSIGNFGFNLINLLSSENSLIYNNTFNDTLSTDDTDYDYLIDGTSTTMVNISHNTFISQRALIDSGTDNFNFEYNVVTLNHTATTSNKNMFYAYDKFVGNNITILDGGATKYMIVFNVYSDTVEIRDNIVNQTFDEGEVIYFDNDDDIIVTGNTFYTYAPMLAFYNSDYFNISNNDFYLYDDDDGDTNEGIYFKYGCRGGYFTNNNIYKKAGTAQVLRGRDTVTDNDDLTFANNYFEFDVPSDNFLMDCDNCDIYNNTVLLNSGATGSKAFYVRATSNTDFYNNNVTDYSSNSMGLQLYGVINAEIYDNYFTTNDSTSYGIYMIDNVRDNNFYNNELLGTGAGYRFFTEEIYAGTPNYFLYNNSLGQIKWSFENMTTQVNVSSTETLVLEQNNVGLQDYANLGTLNSSAEIQIKNLSWTWSPQLLKNGVRCDHTDACNISWDNTNKILTANVTSFSNYTTAEGDNTPPAQSNWSPAKSSTNGATVSLTFDLDENGDCKWSLTDQSYDSMSNDCTGDGTQNMACSLTGLADGAEIVYTACKDTVEENKDTVATNEHIDYTIDASVPTQSGHDPAKGTSINTNTVNMTFTTNENADCKWSLTDQAYSDMAGDCTGDGSTSQSCNATGLLDGAEIVYVACNDSYNNEDSISTNEHVDYIVDGNPPVQSNWDPANESTLAVTSQLIEFDTNENADCKWSLTDQAYSDMAGDCSGDGGQAMACTVTSMIEGTEIVYLSCNDSIGNADTTATNTELTYTIDLTSPTHSNPSPANNSNLTTIEPTITITLDEPGDCKWGKVDRSYSGYNPVTHDCTGDGTTSITCETFLLIEGTEMVYISCNDLYGNKNSNLNNLDLTYFVDVSVPTQSGHDPAKSSTLNSSGVNMTFTTNEDADCKWSLTDQAYGSMSNDCTGDGSTSQSCNATGLSDGAEIIYVACSDVYGNEDTVSTNEHVDYTVDISPPTQSSHNPAKGSTITDTSQVITYTTNENADCKWSLTDQAYGDMAGDCSGDGTTSMSCSVTGMSVGSDIVYTACLDEQGNADTISTNEHIDYTIDTGSPVQSAHSPANDSNITSQSQVVTFTLNENGDCKWGLSDQGYDDMSNDCTGDGTQSMSCSTSGLSLGAEIVYFSCNDEAANNNSASTNTEITYNVNLEPDQPTLNNPGDASTNNILNTILNVTPTDPNGGTVTVQFWQNNATGNFSLYNATSISNGTDANYTWSSRTAGTEYSWFTKVFDGVSTVTSPIWSFTTNYAPSLTATQILPDPLPAASDANASTTYTDFDGTNGTVTANWTVAGSQVLFETFSNVENGSTVTSYLAAGNFSTGQEVIIYFNADDGELSATATSDSIPANNPPVINSNVTVPAIPLFGEDTLAQVNISDGDNHVIQWVNFTLTAPNGTKIFENVNGTMVAGDFTTSTLWNSSSYVIDDTGLWNYSFIIWDGYTQVSGEVYADTGAPSITIYKPIRDYGTNESVPLNYTVTDETASSTCLYYITNASDTSQIMKSSTVVSCIDSINHQTTFDLAYGNYTLFFNATDGYGNVGQENTSFNLIPDSTDPTVSISTPTGIYGTKSGIPLLATVTDDYLDSGNTCWYKVVDPGTGNPIVAPIDYTSVSIDCTNISNPGLQFANNGIYTVFVYAIDDAGNQGVDSSTFTVDEEAGNGTVIIGGSTTTTTQINTTIIQGNETLFCGDGKCSEGENPLTCNKDCKVDFDSLFTCLYDDTLECNWDQNWFVTFLVISLLIIAGTAVYYSEQKKKKNGRKT